MTYQDYVELGRALLKEVRCHQVQIAYYATKVCTIRHGGRSGDLYTLVRYADDIGMKSRTLSDWVSIYRNVIQKLDRPIEGITSHDWTVASKVNFILASEKKVAQELMGLPKRKSKGWKRFVPGSTVKDLFNRNYDKNEIQIEIHQWTDTVIGIKNKLLSRDLSGASSSSLISMKENLDKASDTILNHLTNKRKHSISELVDTNKGATNVSVN
jgi:hypothetical protein